MAEVAESMTCRQNLCRARGMSFFHAERLPAQERGSSSSPAWIVDTPVKPRFYILLFPGNSQAQRFQVAALFTRGDRMSATLRCETPPERARDSWIDFLRVLAAFLVIVDHSADGFKSYGRIPAGDLMIANVLKTFSKSAVPLFLMISGYLLLPVTTDPLQFYRRRFKRIAVP